MAILNLSTMLDHDVRRRALVRIGYFDNTKKRGCQVDDRNVLAWFVKLSRENLADMSPPALGLLHEEVRAIQEEGYGGVTLNESTPAHLPRTQATVAQYLEHLTKTGRIEFEEFKISPSIFVPRFRGLSNFPYSIVSSEAVDPFQGKGLLYIFFLSLKGAGDRLRQCPHCPTLFVQVRRKQQTCSPRCRTRALRARRLKERETRKTKRQRDAHTTSHTRTKKGGKSHGLKKSR